MTNSYPFIRAYRDRVPLVAMAIQEPTLEYLNPATGVPFTPMMKSNVRSPACQAGEVRSTTPTSGR